MLADVGEMTEGQRSLRRCSWPGTVTSYSAGKNSGSVILTLVATGSCPARVRRYPDHFRRPAGRPLVRCSQGFARAKAKTKILISRATKTHSQTLGNEPPPRKSRTHCLRGTTGWRTSHMAALSFSVRADGLPPVLPVALAASRSARVYLHRCLLWLEARQIQNHPQCHLGLLRKALRPSKGSIWLSSMHTRACSDGLPPKPTCSDTSASARFRFIKWCSPSNERGWFDDNPGSLPVLR